MFNFKQSACKSQPTELLSNFLIERNVLNTHHFIFSKCSDELSSYTWTCLHLFTLKTDKEFYLLLISVGTFQILCRGDRCIMYFIDMVFFFVKSHVLNGQRNVRRYITILVQNVNFMLSFYKQIHVCIWMKSYIAHPMPDLFCSTKQFQFTELKLTIYLTPLTMLLVVDT